MTDSRLAYSREWRPITLHDRLISAIFYNLDREAKEDYVAPCKFDSTEAVL